MRFVPVEKIPEINYPDGEKKCIYKPIRKYIEEFMKIGIKIAKVELNDDEYRDYESARVVFSNAVKRHCFPIDVVIRNKEVYLVRRDI